MTGGALPAMTWHGIMAYAHQGLELRELPGIPAPVRKEQLVAQNKQKQTEAPPPRPALLTKRGADILVRVERMMDDANRALPPAAANEDRKRGASLVQPAPLMSELEGAAIGRPSKN
jgi:penicillin-binding protein 1A